MNFLSSSEVLVKYGNMSNMEMRNSLKSGEKEKHGDKDSLSGANIFKCN